MFSQQQDSGSRFGSGQSQEPAAQQQQQTPTFQFGQQQQPAQQQQGQFFQQQPQQSSPFQFGQQQPQQTFGSFGQSAQQPSQQPVQQTGSFGQQQPQSLFASNSGGQEQQRNSGGRGNVDSMGTDGSPIVKWIAASNGHIPEGAVIGGRSSTTQEPYYIGRAKRDNALYPGTVLKSKKVCSFISSQKNRGFGFGGSHQSSCDTNPNYEILVTEDEQGENEKCLTWVYLGPSRTNNTFFGNCNKTCLKVGYDLQGSSTYCGRAPSLITGDLVPGEFKVNTILTTENGQYGASNIYQSGCEVLCITPKDCGDSEILNCYLYDIKYNIDEKKCISWSNKILGRVILMNRSSVEQKMTPSFRVTYNTSFKWELSEPDPKYKQVEIKSEVPFVNGYCDTNDDDNSSIMFLNSQSFYTQIAMDGTTGFGGNNNIYNIHGGRLPSATGGGGGGLFGGGGSCFGGGNPQIPHTKPSGIFTPTVVIVDDLSSSVYYKKRITCNSTSFTVPSISKVTVEYTGQEVTLSVPFKATLKIIYCNDCVHDEEVHGTYKHTIITASFPTVVGEEPVLGM